MADPSEALEAGRDQRSARAIHRNKRSRAVGQYGDVKWPSRSGANQRLATEQWLHRGREHAVSSDDWDVLWELEGDSEEGEMDLIRVVCCRLFVVVLVPFQINRRSSDSLELHKNEEY
jgi:hypothetical protein